MLRARTLARLAVQLAGVGLVGVGLVVLTMGGTAMAAARAADPTPPNAGTSLVAAAAAPTTITSKYSCDLSGYGTSLPAVTLSATVTIPASVAADASLHITLATTASDDLPAAVITALKGVTEFGVTGELAQQPGATGTVSPVSVAGSAKAPASVTALPAVTATGSAVFTTPGTGVIMAPAPTLTIAPLAGSTTLAHITCTTTAAIQNVKVTVTPTVVGTTGPLYTCVETLAGVGTETIDGPIPATITASGARTTGATDTVTYDTAAFGPWTGASSVNVATSLPVTGAQSGQVTMDQAIDPTSADLTVSGKLALTKAGTDHILLPKTMTLTVKATQGALTVTATIVCTLTTTPTPTGLTLSVTKAAGGAHPSSSPSATPSPASTQTGIPTGGADTGGGIGSGPSAGVVAVGGLIAVSGGGLVLVARRRGRQRRRPRD